MLRRLIRNYLRSMKLGQPIRIVLLLAVIFAAGAVTGRLTAPRPPALMAMVDGRVVTSDYLFARMSRELHLSTEQERQFRPLVEEMAREMSHLPPVSRERLEKFKSYLPRMRALLRPEQHDDFERYLRETEVRFERSIRKRGRSWTGAQP